VSLWQAKYTGSYVWTDGEGNLLKPAAVNILSPYDIPFDGTIPVRAGATAGTEVDLTLPGLGTGATILFLANHTGQELGMAWGGNFAPNLPDKGVIVHAYPALPAAGQITGFRFFLTQTQIANGFIAYFAGGS
jgi:hypothetical protein